MPHAKFRSSEQTDKIDAALSKAQAKVRPAVKDATNPHFKSRFASLNSIFDAIRGAFAEAGIAVVQPASSEGDLVTVTTRLSCAGQFYECDLSAKPAQPGPQAIGSVVSYLRRYGLASLAGVPVGDDDDAEEAEGRDSEKLAPTKHAKAAEDVRAAMRTPAFRKQEAIREINAMGLDVRATLKDILGRTFPEGQDIRLNNEAELEKVEERIVLLKAQHNSERASAN